MVFFVFFRWLEEDTIRSLFSKISSDIKKATSKKAAKATEEELIEENASYLDAVEEAQNVEEILEDLKNDSLPYDEDDIHPIKVSTLSHTSFILL